MSTLIARNLVKRYKRFVAVDDVTVSVAAGEVVGLLGPNGAGKTTSFYMIVGLVGADEGEVLLDETDLTAMPMHRRARQGIGYLPQEASVFRGLSVEDNIKAILEIQGETHPEDIERLCDELLHELQIGHLKTKPAIALSGGERRRVEIARALAANPRFMLLDEPFAGVDPISVIDIQRIIGHLRDRGIGVLITDHNVRETLGICDRAYILNSGQVIAEGDPQSILDDPDVRRVYLGDSFRM